MDAFKKNEEIMVSIDTMNEEELRQLSQIVLAKLELVEAKQKEKHTFDLTGSDFRDTNKRHKKPWAKKIISVDCTKKDGFAFIGEFLGWGEVELCEGDVVLQAGMIGSYNNAVYTGIVCQVIEGELTEIDSYNYKREFVSMRNKIEELLNNK